MAVFCAVGILISIGLLVPDNCGEWAGEDAQLEEAEAMLSSIVICLVCEMRKRVREARDYVFRARCVQLLDGDSGWCG